MPNSMPLLRSDLYPGEDDYFQKNKSVTGMAAEDGRVILNPYSTLNDSEKGAVYMNEASRLHMRSKGTPRFDLTEKQSAFLNGNSYKDASDDDRRQTILARIISGDKSAGDTTPEQIRHAEAIKQQMNDFDYMQAWSEGSK